MKVLFLGTGASEGIPSVFCDCSVCTYARKNGGKENRSRMGMLINDDLLLDISPDLRNEIYSAKVKLDNVYNVIITHSHSDHLSLDGIIPQICFLNGASSHKVNVYGSDKVIDKIEKNLSCYQPEDRHLSTFRVEIGKSFNVKDYKITALHSRHMMDEKSLYYLIEKDGKKYLHLCDGGEFFDETLELLGKIAKDCDLIVYDMTFGLIKQEFFGHCNFNQVERRINKFKEMGIVTEKTINVVTHISHWAGTHKQLEEKLKDSNIIVAYDGMKIEI